MIKTFKIDESASRLPYIIFCQSKGGWPVFYLYATLEEAEKGVDGLRTLKLKPVLYLDLSDAEIVDD